MFKSSLQLDKVAQLAWANALLANYQFDHAVQAIEQLKHSDVQWVNFGSIATEARRIAVTTSREYRPYANHKRLTNAQLREASADGNELAAQRLKNEQIKQLNIE